MSKTKIIIIFPILFLTSVSNANCYSGGEGPYEFCYEGNRRVRVAKPFIDLDGNLNSYDRAKRTFCYTNKYDKKRCIQKWKIKTLRCKNSSGMLYCK